MRGLEPRIQDATCAAYRNLLHVGARIKSGDGHDKRWDRGASLEAALQRRSMQ